jgi:serine/threonine protein kinase
MYPKVPKSVAVFRREVQILKSLSSQLIVSCLDWFEAKNGYVMILQDGGENLLDRANGTAPIAEEKLCTLARQMFLAVKEVSDHRWIHGDIKLENFVIDENERIRLIDFGLSESIAETGFSQNSVCGSRFYQAPELLQHLRHDQKVDIWALGVTLFALAARSFPFSTDEYDHYCEVLVHPPLMDLIYDSYSLELADLLQWMLSKDPQERFSIDECLAHPWFARSQNI